MGLSLIHRKFNFHQGRKKLFKQYMWLQVTNIWTSIYVYIQTLRSYCRNITWWYSKIVYNIRCRLQIGRKSWFQDYFRKYFRNQNTNWRSLTVTHDWIDRRLFLLFYVISRFFHWLVGYQYSALEISDQLIGNIYKSCQVPRSCVILDLTLK